MPWIVSNWFKNVPDPTKRLELLVVCHDQPRYGIVKPRDDSASPHSLAFAWSAEWWLENIPLK